VINVEVAVARGRVPLRTSAARGRVIRPISQTTAATGPGAPRLTSDVLRAFFPSRTSSSGSVMG